MAASKKTSSAPPEAIERYERMVASHPDAERLGATMPYTSCNGNMYSYLHPSGAVALRLSKEDREAFLAKYDSKLFEAYGVVQKEYVTVPDSLMANLDELAPWFAKSLEYCQSLRPKKKAGQ